VNFSKFLKKIVILFFLFFVLTAGISHSQTLVGKIVGTVTDEDDIAFPGVAVEISSPSLMGIRTDVTSIDGRYRFVSLSPGTYKVVFSLGGFKGIERQNVRVTIGGTVTIDATLEPATLEEEITVIAEAPLIDVEKSGMSSTFTGDDLIKLPVSRTSMRNLIEMHPGYFQGSSFGSDQFNNNFVVDGLSVSSPEAGRLRMPPHVDTLEEMEVISLGAPAEYGQFMGAVVNIVTKYGGNKLSGSLSYYSQPDFLISDNNPKPDEWQSYESLSWYDISGTFSGALANDKLWFFAHLDRTFRKTVGWRGDPDYPRPSMAWNAEFKLTGQIGTKHKISGNMVYVLTDSPSTLPSPWVMPEAAADSYFSKPGYFANWTWMISKNAYLSAHTGYWANLERSNAPVDEVYSNPTHYDEYTDILSGGADHFTYWNNAKFQVNTDVSYYAENFMGGSHDFKIGVQFTRGLSHPKGGWPGNKEYLDWDGEPNIMFEQNTHHYGGFTTSIGVFADDSLKIGDRLTINAGVRFDHSNCDIPAWPRMDGIIDLDELAPGFENIIVWSTISPRLGFTLQLTPDYKTILKAFYGRFHESPRAACFGMPGPGVRDFFKYQWTGTDWDLVDFTAGSMGFFMDPDIKNPYSDQFTLGIERELLTDFSIGVQGIYKNDKYLVGLEDRGGIYEEVQRVSPDDGKTYTVYNMVGGEHAIWQTNPESYYSKYKALTFTLNKRYSHNWMLKASLVWSKAEGLTTASATYRSEGSGQSLYGNDFGRAPNDLVNAAGELAFSRRWMIKVQTSFELPFGTLASANWRYMTGRPYRVMVRIEDLNQGLRRIFDEPRGRRRWDAEHLLNLRLQKTFIIESVSATIIADIFNALNGDTPTRFRSYNMDSGNFLAPRSMYTPRIIQLGFKLEF